MTAVAADVVAYSEAVLYPMVVKSLSHCPRIHNIVRQELRNLFNEDIRRAQKLYQLQEVPIQLVPQVEFRLSQVNIIVADVRPYDRCQVCIDCEVLSYIESGMYVLRNEEGVLSLYKRAPKTDKAILHSNALSLFCCSYCAGWLVRLDW